MVALGAALAVLGGPTLRTSMGELSRRVLAWGTVEAGAFSPDATDVDRTRSASSRAEIPSFTAWTDAVGVPSASPLPVTVRISSPFGMRRHPVIGDVRHHDGVDLAAPLGTPALATASGVVAWSGVRGGYGRTVDVRHAQSGLVTRYAHLDAVAPGIAAGVSVSRGTVLGFVGETGLATGPHLHYEVRSHSGPLDPVTLTERYRRLYAEARGVHGRAWDRWVTAQQGGVPGGR